MKTIVSNELRKRLESASKNGSVIATDVLNELKKDKKECFGDKCCDYFDSVRVLGSGDSYKSLSIKISVCTKDVNNEHFPDKGNPRAPWFKENRQRVSLGAFVGFFKNLQDKYSSDDYLFFESAMCVPDVVKFRLSNKMEDFERAYNANNYYPFGISGSPLHNSCMRHDETSRNAADFYVNFAGAKILIAEDTQGQILGRAIFWPNVNIPQIKDNCKVLDRIYSVFDFVRVKMIDYAREQGIDVRKNKNFCGTECEVFSYIEEFQGLRHWTMEVNVPQIKWHKHGAPYMDTFCYLLRDEGVLKLRNSAGSYLARFQSTSGYGSLNRNICPNCGRTHCNKTICDDCVSELMEYTPLGLILKCKTKTYKGKKYPISFFDNGKPTANFEMWIGLKKLTDSSFSF